MSNCKKELAVGLAPQLAAAVAKPRLQRKEAALYLERIHGIPMAHSTLAKYVTTGGGPSYQKAGRRPLYPVDALDQWATKRLGKLISSSSEET